jgi:hypothetical protein
MTVSPFTFYRGAGEGDGDRSGYYADGLAWWCSFAATPTCPNFGGFASPERAAACSA